MVARGKGKPVRIEPEVYEQVKRAAARLKITIGAMIVTAWKQYKARAK